MKCAGFCTIQDYSAYEDPGNPQSTKKRPSTGSDLKMTQGYELCPQNSCTEVPTTSTSRCDSIWGYIALQAPLSMGFPRKEYWSRLPCPSPGVLPNPGVEPRSPALQADFLSSELLGKPCLETESSKRRLS